MRPRDRIHRIHREMVAVSALLFFVGIVLDGVLGAIAFFSAIAVAGVVIVWSVIGIERMTRGGDDE